ncbi:MAG: acyl-CoA dehydrogenase [Novosphingobium sp.]|nr:acyl-CoA dehydrogenase [Novosphingobium sp.]
MNLDLDEQQMLMAETADRFFKARSSMAGAREIGGGVSLPLWRETAEMGFVAMRMPEDAGGAGAGLLDAALVCEAAGRTVAPIPLADSMAGYRLLTKLGGDVARQMLDAIEEMPLALFPQDGATVLTCESGAVTATTPCGEAITVAEGNEIPVLFEQAREETAILRSAYLVGAMTQAIELASAYACEREQFDRPIGSFQGIAFPLAESITDAEGGRLLNWHAICSIAEGSKNAAALVAMAQWWTAKSARIAATRSLRTFGGYGLSLEYDIHLYFNAINRMALAGGDPDKALLAAGNRLWMDGKVALPDTGETGIETGLGAEAEAFRQEVRRFFEAEMTPELRAKAHHSTEGHDPEFHRKLAAAGLAYPDWPKKWGGREAGAMEVTALGRVFEEYRWTRVPIGTTNMGARMVMKFGSSELQEEVLPPIAEGRALGCLGFTEPGSGSDMFAARTRAVRDGDDWLISGQKMFTTGAHISDYILLIARTDPDKPKHRGITIFFFPMSLPGITIQPVHTLQDERTNITFFDEVRVPDRYRLGEVDGGLAVMAAAMEIEHGGEGYHINHRSLMEAVEQWSHAPGAGGKRPIDDPAIRAAAAKVATHMEIADLLCRRATWAGEAAKGSRSTGPMAKLFATEIYMHDAADMVALAAPASLRHETPALAEIEDRHRQSISQTIYGGTSEVHRGIIAQYALNLPRAN